MSPHSSKFVKPMKTLVEEQAAAQEEEAMSDDELDELELTEANMIRKAATRGNSANKSLVRKSNTEESLSKLVQVSTPSVMSSGYGSQPLSGTPVSEEDSVSIHSSGNEETPSTVIENKIPREMNGNGVNNVSRTTATQQMVSNNSFTSDDLNRSNGGDNESVSSKGSKTDESRNVTLPDWMVVGESVRVSPDSKTGIISFIGTTHFQPGLWVGVTLDAPTGKNDGSVNGVAYFNCKPRFGIFVKPDKLKLDIRGKTLRSSTSGSSTSLLKSVKK